MMTYTSGFSKKLPVVVMRDMATQSFFVPGPLPGGNDYLGKKTRFLYARNKKNWTTVIAYYLRQANLQPMQSVSLKFLWIEPNQKRDPDNITGIARKWILDALVTCGILPNDGWGQIKGWEDTWTTDGDPGVWVMLETR